MSKQSKWQHDQLTKREAGRTNSDEPRTAGEALRRQAIADAKTLGPGSITRANRQRARWGLAAGGDLFPTSVASPRVQDLCAFVAALGSDVSSYCERTARYSSGPLADLMALAESVKERRPGKRIPKYLGAARARTWRPHVELAEGMLEILETMRFDDPRSALKASRSALKEAGGPISVGRVLAIHASNLRECDELAEALFALRVAIPALDMAGDAWGMGRTLTTAAAVVRSCGHFELALALINRAEAWYHLAGSAEGRGTTLAFRGVLFLNASEPRAALQELDAALVFLPPANRLYVAGAHQVRALALVEAGDLPAARKAVSAALAVAPDARAARGRIAWHAGDIETAAGDQAAAESLYRQAFALIAAPVCDRMLLAALTINAAMRQGASGRALATAKTMLEPLFERLDTPNPTHRGLAAAHAGLYRAALDAGLSSAVIEQAIGRIEAARTARRRRIRRQVS